MKILNVAILGFGLSGATFHAPLIARIEGFCLKYFLSSNKEKVHKYYPEAKVYNDFDLLCQQPDLDLVIIATPNAEHYTLAKQALLKGKHVIVDKPFVLTTAQGVELISIARQKNVFLSVFQNRRYDDGFLTLQKCRQENLLKDIYLYEAYFDRFRPQINFAKWKEQEVTGAGILYDLGSHLLDQALVTLGLPQAIFADCQMQRPQAKVIDYFQIILDYGKTRAVLGASNLMLKPRPVLAVQAANAHFIKIGLDPQERALSKLHPNEQVKFTSWGITSSSTAQLQVIQNGQPMNYPISLIPGNYFLYYEQVYQAIVAQKNNPVTPEQALNVIYLIELAIQSNKLKQWIKVDSKNIV